MCPQIKGKIISNCYKAEMQIEIGYKAFTKAIVKLVRIDIDKAGVFEYNSDEEVSGSIFINLLLINKDGKAETIKEFGPYCNQEEINIQYYFKPKDYLVWYPYINSQIQKVLAEGSLHKVEEAEYNLLACQACVEEADIRELVTC